MYASTTSQSITIKIDPNNTASNVIYVPAQAAPKKRKKKVRKKKRQVVMYCRKLEP